MSYLHPDFIQAAQSPTGPVFLKPIVVPTRVSQPPAPPVSAECPAALNNPQASTRDTQVQLQGRMAQVTLDSCQDTLSIDKIKGTRIQFLTWSLR